MGWTGKVLRLSSSFLRYTFLENSYQSRIKLIGNNLQQLNTPFTYSLLQWYTCVCWGECVCRAFLTLLTNKTDLRKSIMSSELILSTCFKGRSDWLKPSLISAEDFTQWCHMFCRSSRIFFKRDLLYREISEIHKVTKLFS